MTQTAQITGDQLTNALHALGVKFILGGRTRVEDLHTQPARLIAALAESDESRLRLSLIPLFLEHPEFSAHVQAVASLLNPTARITLQCYYSAAVWLGQVHCKPAISLPDFFSSQLDLHPTDDPEENLCALAERHSELTGTRVNWLGTYQHAAHVWQKSLEVDRG